MRHLGKCCAKRVAYEIFPLNGTCLPLDNARPPVKASPVYAATHVPIEVMGIAIAPAPTVSIVAVITGEQVTPP